MWNLLRPIIGLFWTLWGVLDGLRKVLSLTFLLCLVIFVLAALEPDNAAVPQNVALVLTPKGALVEQLSGDPIDRAIAKARGLQQQEVLVKDLIDTIHVAKDDDRIVLLVLDLEGLSGGGLSKLRLFSSRQVVRRSSHLATVSLVVSIILRLMQMRSTCIRWVLSISMAIVVICRTIEPR